MSLVGTHVMRTRRRMGWVGGGDGEGMGRLWKGCESEGFGWKGCVMDLVTWALQKALFGFQRSSYSDRR